MSIVRSPRPASNFTILQNEVLRDRHLSFRARGLLALLLSFPDGWKTNAERLALLSTDGRDSIRSGLRELERRGYIVRRRVQDARGRWATETVVYDVPQSPELSTVHPLPATDSPASESQALREELRQEGRIQANSYLLARGTCPECNDRRYILHEGTPEECIRCEGKP